MISFRDHISPFLLCRDTYMLWTDNRQVTTDKCTWLNGWFDMMLDWLIDYLCVRTQCLQLQVFTKCHKHFKAMLATVIQVACTVCTSSSLYYFNLQGCNVKQHEIIHKSLLEKRNVHRRPNNLQIHQSPRTNEPEKATNVFRKSRPSGLKPRGLVSRGWDYWRGLGRELWLHWNWGELIQWSRASPQQFLSQ